MTTRWIIAFAAATLFSALATPLARRLAFRIGLIDEPDPNRKVHQKPIPYLGGIAIVGAVFAGMTVAGSIPPRAAIVAAAAGLVASVGLLDDDRALRPVIRVITQAAAATLVVGVVGVRADLTGVPMLDGALTAFGIVAVTNALNLLDNMDGLATGIAVTSGLALFVLAGLAGQEIVSSLAIAIVGAGFGFLVHNFRPATIFMGDAGSLFLGFLLAVGAVEVSPLITPPASVSVPLLLLAVPIIDTLTVVITRLTHGRSVFTAGKDHLSHRLTNRGLSQGMAVGVLIGVQAAFGALAIAYGNGDLSAPVTAAIAAAIVAALIGACTGVPVYESAGTSVVWRVMGSLSAAAVALMLIGGPATTLASDLFDDVTVDSGLEGRARPTGGQLVTGGVVPAVVVVGGSLFLVIRRRRRPEPADVSAIASREEPTEPSEVALAARR